MAARDRSRSPHGGADDEVFGLIVQREQARQAKDFGTADHLRERLTQLGVTLFDKTNQWRTADGRSGRIPSFNEIEGGVTGDSLAMMQSGGMGGMVGGVSGYESSDPQESHIKQLVLLREQARAQKDFAQSDRLRDELKALGVDLFDKEKMWRSKTGSSGVIVGYRGNGGPTDLEITTLVVQREKARQSGDWGTADMVRNELKQFGVDIFDKDKMWRSTDGRSGPVPSWTIIQAGDGLGGAAATGQVAVGGDVRQQVLQAAVQAAQNPATAARTLQLLQQAGVSVPGVRGGGGAGMMAMPSAAPKFQQRGGAVARSPEAAQAIGFIQQCQAQGRAAADGEIEWLVQTREKIRQNKDYPTADEIRNLMKSALGVELFEKEKRWQCTDGRQGLIPMWGSMTS